MNKKHYKHTQQDKYAYKHERNYRLNKEQKRDKKQFKNLKKSYQGRI